MPVGAVRNVLAAKGGDLLLPVRAADGRLDHQVAAASGVPLELDAAHPDEAGSFHEAARHRLHGRDGLGGGDAKSRAADPGRVAQLRPVKALTISPSRPA